MTELATRTASVRRRFATGFAELVARNVLVSRRGPGSGYWVAKRDANLQRLTDEFVERARKTGNGDIAIAETVRARFPRRDEEVDAVFAYDRHFEDERFTLL